MVLQTIDDFANIAGSVSAAGPRPSSSMNAIYIELNEYGSHVTRKAPVRTGIHIYKV